LDQHVAEVASPLGRLPPAIVKPVRAGDDLHSWTDHHERCPEKAGVEGGGALLDRLDEPIKAQRCSKLCEHVECSPGKLKVALTARPTQ
jgi:hypothetical protein